MERSSRSVSFFGSPAKGSILSFSPAATVNAGPPLATPDVKVAPHPDESAQLDAYCRRTIPYFRDEAQIGVTGSAICRQDCYIRKEYAYSVQAFIDKRESD